MHKIFVIKKLEYSLAWEKKMQNREGNFRNLVYLFRCLFALCSPQNYPLRHHICPCFPLCCRFNELCRMNSTMGPKLLDSKLSDWSSGAHTIHACIVIHTSIEVADSGDGTEVESLVNEILGFLPGSIRGLSEPPFDPSPEIFNGIHLVTIQRIVAGLDLSRPWVEFLA